MIWIFFFMSSSVWAKLPSLPLNVTVVPSKQNLTTERVWIVDPQAGSPHRQMWVLKREIEMVGLETTRSKKGFFGIKADRLDASAESFVRGKGPWFSEYIDFPCSKRVQAWFFHQDGARKAVDWAADEWKKVLGDELVTLTHKLRKIRHRTRLGAVIFANEVFKNWRDATNQKWRKRVNSVIRKKEWAYYRRQAKKAGACKGEKKIRPKRWEEMMPLPSAPFAPRPRVRAPARRWDGRYSIRVAIEIAGKKLVGQFLLDTGSQRSLLSRIWLEDQGVRPSWWQQGEKIPTTVHWTLGKDYTTLVRVGGAWASGMPLGLRQFWLLEPEIASPPRSIAFCCDGILGADFFRSHVVGIDSDHPARINIWSRAGFHRPTKDYFWVEAHLNRRGQIESDCVAVPVRAKGLIWNTVRPGNLLVGRDRAGQLFGDQKLVCGGAEWEGVRLPTRVSAVVKGKKMIAAQDMISNGRVIFDLPHGRVWVHKESLRRPTLTNHSGLKLVFISQNGSRRLKVKRISDVGRTKTLYRKGLRKDMFVSRINSRDVDELDQWHVDRHLAGAFGDTLQLEWESGGVVRITPLRVR